MVNKITTALMELTSITGSVKKQFSRNEWSSISCYSPPPPLHPQLLSADEATKASFSLTHLEPGEDGGGGGGGREVAEGRKQVRGVRGC